MASICFNRQQSFQHNNEVFSLSKDCFIFPQRRHCVHPRACFLQAWNACSSDEDVTDPDAAASSAVVTPQSSDRTAALVQVKGEPDSQGLEVAQIVPSKSKAEKVEKGNTIILSGVMMLLGHDLCKCILCGRTSMQVSLYKTPHHPWDGGPSAPFLVSAIAWF